MTTSWFVYVLTDAAGAFYFGITGNPRRRFAQHRDPVRCHNLAVHDRLVAGKGQMVVLASGLTEDAARALEAGLIAANPGTLNRPAGVRRGGSPVTFRVSDQDLEFLERFRRSFSPPLTRDQALASLVELASVQETLLLEGLEPELDSAVYATVPGTERVMGPGEVVH